MASNVNQHNQLLALFAVYKKKLDKLYDDFVQRLINALPYTEEQVWQKLTENSLFNFDDLPYLRARLNHIFEDYYNKQILCYKSGITDGVALAYTQDDINIGKYSILQDSALKAARNTAVSTFIATRMSRKEGLSLSDKVWNYSQLGKSEVEMGISNVLKDGLSKGTSAETMGRLVRQYLNNPTMMYRRYWVNVATSAGKKKVARWYRRHIDPKTGKVTFKNEPLEKVGMGVYRSARMNGYRLMRTEVNMAYHNANASRWANEPFVYGIRVWRSPQHPEEDICDELEGYYPKNFVFEGWHPACMCASAPLTLFGDEKKDFYNRLMKGEDMSNFHSQYEITAENMNPNWKRYIETQHDNILKAAERGKLAYFLRDNQQYWLNTFSAAEQKKMGLSPVLNTPQNKASARHAVRTEEDKKRLTEWWHEHKRIDALVRQATPLANDLREYTLAEYNTLRQAIDKRDGTAIEKLLNDKLLAKKLAYEKQITPPQILWSNLTKIVSEDQAKAWLDVINNIRDGVSSNSFPSYNIAKNTISNLNDVMARLFTGEKKDAVDALFARTQRFTSDYYAFKRQESKINMALSYLKKNISSIGGAAVVPSIDVTQFYLGNIVKMQNLASSVGDKVRKVEAVVNNAAFVAKSTSPVVRNLYHGILYALKKYGLDADVDEYIAKLESNIARLTKAAAKTTEKKMASLAAQSTPNVETIEKTLINATKAITLQGDDKYKYYTQMVDAIEKALTYRQGTSLPKALLSRKKLLFDAIRADISDNRIAAYYERYRHGIAVLHTYDLQVNNGLRTSLGNFTERLASAHIRYKKVPLLTQKLDEDAIINKIGGRDRTKGSCSSLAFTYAGNRYGLDVRDFRGGSSRLFFATKTNINEIISQCGGIVIQDYDDFAAAKKVLNLVESGKEYYFTSGRHAAIIRKTGKGLEYLELQSFASNNGFRPLTEERLRNRFKCRYNVSYKASTSLIEIGKLAKDKKFGEVLGYINTAENAQKKGIGGGIK